LRSSGRKEDEHAEVAGAQIGVVRPGLVRRQPSPPSTMRFQPVAANQGDTWWAAPAKEASRDASTPAKDAGRGRGAPVRNQAGGGLAGVGRLLWVWIEIGASSTRGQSISSSLRPPRPNPAVIIAGLDKNQAWGAPNFQPDPSYTPGNRRRFFLSGSGWDLFGPVRWKKQCGCGGRLH
jgi:hypothetical protein